jgi:hypothetical protein
MLVTPVVQEFNDFRAYVSHDLCKQRMVLFLDNPSKARYVFLDAYVWPLLRVEAKRLFELAPTLFGLTSPHFEIQQGLATEIIERIDLLESDVVAGKKSGLVRLVTEAADLSNSLTELSEKLQNTPPGFSEENVRRYLDGMVSNDRINEFLTFISTSIKPVVESVFSTTDSAQAYSRFWSLSPEMDLHLRKILVSVASEDVYPESIDEIVQGRILTRSLRQIMAAWSPSIESELRDELLSRALEAYGFENTTQVIDMIEEFVCP